MVTPEPFQSKGFRSCKLRRAEVAEPDSGNFGFGDLDFYSADSTCWTRLNHPGRWPVKHISGAVPELIPAGSTGQVFIKLIRIWENQISSISTLSAKSTWDSCRIIVDCVCVCVYTWVSQKHLFHRRALRNFRSWDTSVPESGHNTRDQSKIPGNPPCQSGTLIKRKKQTHVYRWIQAILTHAN